MRKLLLILLCMLMAATPAVAQQEEDEDTIDLGVVVVEADPLQPEAEEPAPDENVVEVGQPEPQAEASPEVAGTIGREQLESDALDSADRVLEREPGFVVDDTFAGSSVSYHGLPGKFSEVTVDGQRLPGHIFEQVDFGQLPLGGVERIEVLRGAQAAAYGADSAGVIVNLIPRRPTGSGGEATLGAGSFGYNRQHLLLFEGDDEHDWNFSIERALREAYDLNRQFPDTDGDGYRRYDVSGSYNQRFGADELKLRAEYFNENSNGKDFSPPNLIRQLDTDTKRWQATGSYRCQLSPCQSLTLAQNYGVYKHDLERFFVAFPDTRDETGFTDSIWDSRLDWEKQGTTTWRAGLERSFDRIVSDRISVGEAEQVSYGGYATANWHSGNWTFDAALRADVPEGFDSVVTPKLGATLKLDEHSTLALGAGMGYRAPSLRERYYEFASPFGYTVLGNPDLKEEKSTSYTADWLRQTKNSRWSAGVFHHDVRNLITFSQTQAVPQVFTTENVGDARSTGFSLGAEHRWRVSGCDCCGSHFGLGWDGVFLTDAQDTDLGTRLANAPRTDNTLRAYYEMDDLRTEARWRMLSSRYLDRENLTLAPAYSTLDVNLNKQEGNGDWRLAALNVLDEKDGRFGPEPGRELRVEYTLHW
jgi:outer membrane receptor for ferrienterochelin and colicins